MARKLGKSVLFLIEFRPFSDIFHSFIVRLAILDFFEPHWNVEKLVMFGHFRSKICLFWADPDH